MTSGFTERLSLSLAEAMDRCVQPLLGPEDPLKVGEVDLPRLLMVG